MERAYKTFENTPKLPLGMEHVARERPSRSTCAAVVTVAGMVVLLPWLIMHAMLANDGGDQALFAATSGLSSTPNVVYLFADDLGWFDISSTSHKWSTLTPFIDQLMYDGIRLTRYYTQPMCTPARAALMTGKYPIHNGMHHDVIQVDGEWGLPLSEKIFPQYLLELGYQTSMIGKWHLGHFAADYLPNRRGFEKFFGFVSGMEFYYDHTQTFEFDETRYYDFLDAEGDDYSVARNYRGTYSPILFHERSKKIIRDRDPSKPIYLYMSYQNVHSPLDDPPSYFFSDSQLQLISSLDNPFERSYAMSLVALDWSVQKIYEQLEENNMLDDTLIVFASDNGGCSLGGGFNFPLRGDKVSLFEGGVLVNAFVWSNSQTIIPQHLRGTTYDNLFHVTDWLPTIVGGMLGRVDILPPNLDGSDQWNAMMQRTTEVPRSEILLNIDNYEGSADHQRGIIVDKLKMIYDYDIGYSEPSALSEPESAMNSSYGVIDCILGTHYTFKQFVFNLEDDPYEQTNLAMTIDSTILKELAERLSSYYGSVTDPCWSDELSDAEDELLVQQYNKMLDAWETSGGVVPWASDPYMSCHF